MTTKGKRGADDRFCTFCSKSRGEVRNLIAGPGEICICDECVEICNQILKVEKRAAPSGSPVPGRSELPFEFADFSLIAGLPCYDGTSRRAYRDPARAPYTLQLLELGQETRTHYHKFQTETYYFLEGEGQMELNGKLYPVKSGMG